MCGSRQSIVSFKFDHRPNDDAHRGQRVFQRMKLRQQRAFDAGTRFVTRPKFIAKRFDDVIARDTHMSYAVLDHLHDRIENAGDGAERRIGLVKTAQPIEVTKEFVGAVDEMNDHVKVLATDEHRFTQIGY